MAAVAHIIEEGSTDTLDQNIAVGAEGCEGDLKEEGGECSVIDVKEGII